MDDGVPRFRYAGHMGDAAPLTTARAVRAALQVHASEERARVSRSFFKTGPGEYGEGDRFLGVTVPDTRAVAKRAATLPETELDRLLASPWHEERLLALLVLVRRYEKGSREEKAWARAYYRANLARANNWDLVDLSAWQILGRALRDEDLRASPRAPSPPADLVTLARSPNLWERRVAMVATFAWIKEGEAEPARAIAATLLGDREDLMHKAVGWMLREVGKRASREALVAFLEAHAEAMPRTALRYAIEHFAPEDRALWLARGRGRIALRKAP
jgi:3-methyladenine DNA glycosylase AlkD